MRLHWSGQNIRPDYDLVVSTTNLGDAAEQMVACVQSL